MMIEPQEAYCLGLAFSIIVIAIVSRIADWLADRIGVEIVGTMMLILMIVPLIYFTFNG